MRVRFTYVMNFENQVVPLSTNQKPGISLCSNQKFGCMVLVLVGVQIYFSDSLCRGQTPSQSKREDPLRNKTFESLNHCRHNQSIILNFTEVLLPNSISVSNICTSEDLHRIICEPTSKHSRTCIRTSEDLHQNIRTCIKLARDLGTFIKPSRPASIYRNLSGQLNKEAGYTINELFISWCTLSLNICLDNFYSIVEKLTGTGRQANLCIGRRLCHQKLNHKDALQSVQQGTPGSLFKYVGIALI